MTNEEKQILLKDLCARLPYGVMCNISTCFVFEDGTLRRGSFDKILDLDTVTTINGWKETEELEKLKPYLRPMSSMTDKEKDELRDIIYFGNPSDDYDKYGHRGVEVAIVEYDEWGKIEFDFDDFCTLEKWLNANHFDYRGLISKGLAIEAPEGMYDFK